MKVKITYKANDLRAFMSRQREVPGTQVRVGVFGGATHEAKKGEPAITLVELAAIHEFGSPAAGIPERSFIRRTLNAQRDAIEERLRAAAKGVLSGKVSIAKALNLIGQWAVAEIKKTITGGAGVSPPLRPATIAAKGSSRPLVDTGQLKNSITHVVVAGGEAEAGGGE